MLFFLCYTIIGDNMNKEKPKINNKLKSIFLEDNSKKEYYNDQKVNCLMALVLSVLFILGLVFKTVINYKTIDDIKMMIFLILPILFMNATFYTLLKIFKNQVESSFLKKETEVLLKSVVYEVMLFILSLLILLNKDSLNNHQLYIIIIMGIYFLFSGSFVKKMFQFELKKNS